MLLGFKHRSINYQLVTASVFLSLLPFNIYPGKVISGNISRDLDISSEALQSNESTEDYNYLQGLDRPSIDSLDIQAISQGSKNSQTLGKPVAAIDLDDNLDQYALSDLSSYVAEKTDKKIAELARQKSIQDYNYVKSPNKVILFVWDGLRRDVITPEYTPNLYKLKQSGSYFSDHHSSYPTVTMNNANSIATGNYAGETGFYGNSSWRPDVASYPGQKIDFIQPVFTQQHYVLQGLSQAKNSKPLMYVETLLQRARQYGLRTAQIGKAGPIALQDAHQPSGNALILTENKVYPESFGKKLQEKGYFLPKKAVSLYPDTSLKLKENNNSPTKKAKLEELSSIDGKIPLIGVSNPEETQDARYQAGNEYFMDIFVKEILPSHQPDVSIIWLREPDTTEHAYGPGSKSFYQALANQDKLLGKLLLNMNKLGLMKTTNLLIASDHGHSTVAGDLELFPLRKIQNDQIAGISQDGYSVSGYVRVADLLTKAGFKAYDGIGCIFNPVQNGIFKDGTLLSNINIDKDGSICEQGNGALYTSRSYIVPKELPEGAVVVANNGGSVFIYVPDGNNEVVKKLVSFLQSRLEFDSIFIDSLYGNLPGTLPLKMVDFYDQNQERHPDIVVSMSYDAKSVVKGLPGTAYSSTELDRGSHGTLSPIDIGNVFIGYGPNFRENYVDNLPTGNVDVPVTMAYILNLPFFDRQGRPVLEALNSSGVKASDYVLKYAQIQPSEPATGLKIQSLTSLEGKDLLTDKDSYTFVLNTKQLSYKDHEVRYIDSSKAIRY